MYANEAWIALRLYWITLYAGSPDYAHADTRTNFTVKEFIEALDKLDVVMNISAIE